MEKHLLEEKKHSENIYLTQFHEMVMLMYESLETLIRLDHQLNTLQPVHNGRLRIQWSSYPSLEGHYTGERYPRFVQWNKNFALGLWRAKKIPIARVLQFQHRSRDFKAHAVKVRELLVNMRELMLIYRQARKTLAQLRGPSSKWIHIQQTRIEKMHLLCTPEHQEQSSLKDMIANRLKA